MQGFGPYEGPTIILYGLPSLRQSRIYSSRIIRRISPNKEPARSYIGLFLNHLVFFLWCFFCYTSRWEKSAFRRAKCNSSWSLLLSFFIASANWEKQLKHHWRHHRLHDRNEIVWFFSIGVSKTYSIWICHICEYIIYPCHLVLAFLFRWMEWDVKLPEQNASYFLTPAFKRNLSFLVMVMATTS